MTEKTQGHGYFRKKKWAKGLVSGIAVAGIVAFSAGSVLADEAVQPESKNDNNTYAKQAGKATGIPALKAAYAEEGFYVGANQLDALCAIKSKNEVIAEVITLLQSPAKNVISALTSAGSTIHGVLETIGKKNA